MNIVTYTDARKQLKAVMDLAIHDKEETIITRSGAEAVVVVGKEEWDAIQETLHLLAIPGMRESIQAGRAEPLDRSARELKW